MMNVKDVQRINKKKKHERTEETREFNPDREQENLDFQHPQSSSSTTHKKTTTRLHIIKKSIKKNQLRNINKQILTQQKSNTFLKEHIIHHTVVIITFNVIFTIIYISSSFFVFVNGLIFYHYCIIQYHSCMVQYGGMQPILQSI